MKTSYFEGPAGKIAFHESGSGRPIVLVHGNSSSARIVERQLASRLGQKHRLIALDLPGHGQSADAVNTSTYTLPGYAGVLVALAKHLGVEDAIFAGWSLGGHIVLEAVSQLPMAAGFAIFGTPPLGFPPAMDKAFLPNPAMGAIFAADMTKEQAAAFGEAAFQPGFADIPSFFIEDALRTDGRAREELGKSVGTGNYHDEVSIVAELKSPLAVLHGAEEQLINGTYFDGLKMPTLWRGSIQTIADAGHTPHWEQPEAFNALLEAFVEDSN
jgi:pimeloyl-ACP methyl ester carboxylesterase